MALLSSVVRRTGGARCLPVADALAQSSVVSDVRNTALSEQTTQTVSRGDEQPLPRAPWSRPRPMQREHREIAGHDWPTAQEIPQLVQQHPPATDKLGAISSELRSQVGRGRGGHPTAGAATSVPTARRQAAEIVLLKSGIRKWPSGWTTGFAI